MTQQREQLRETIDNILGENAYGIGAFETVDNKFRFAHTPDELVDIRNKLLDLFSSELSIVEKKAYTKAAEIVRAHTLWDWSGEQEIYNELEEIAKKIDALSKQ